MTFYITHRGFSFFLAETNKINDLRFVIISHFHFFSYKQASENNQSEKRSIDGADKRSIFEFFYYILKQILK
jgi:hypothetical protein